MYDLCAIGDALIDFIPAAGSSREQPVYQCNVGGTVCNLLVAASRLGMHTMFAGKVGDDCMGDLIWREMERLSIDRSGYVKDPEHFTTQSFVTLGENGERSFSFSRRYGADIFLRPEEVPMEKMMDARFIHFSGMSMTDEPIRSATFEVLKEAGKRGRVVTVDVNYRDRLWKSAHDMIEVMNAALPFVTLYKSSDEEALLVSGEKTLEAAAEKIRALGCRFVLISCGERGCYYSYRGGKGMVPSYLVEAVDTTGAGDCFFAAFLYLLRSAGDMETVPEERMISMLRFANAAGALTTTCRGGAAGAPSVAGIEKCMRENPIRDI